MVNKNLRNSLQHLLEQLNKKDTPVDENTRKLKSDIQTILNKPDDQPSQEHKNLMDNLSSSVERLEASHPTLTSEISNIINILSGMGI